MVDIYLSVTLIDSLLIQIDPLTGPTCKGVTLACTPALNWAAQLALLLTFLANPKGHRN